VFDGNSNSGQDVVNGKPLSPVKHRDPYSGAAKFSDPSEWECASYTPDMGAELLRRCSVAE
jgi:hypothetical protein